MRRIKRTCLPRNSKTIAINKDIPFIPSIHHSYNHQGS
jgi:hypothetical protein